MTRIDGFLDAFVAALNKNRAVCEIRRSSRSTVAGNLSFGCHEVNSGERPGDARQFCVSGHSSSRQAACLVAPNKRLMNGAEISISFRTMICGGRASMSPLLANKTSRMDATAPRPPLHQDHSRRAKEG
jgi:hypothetical protein